MKAIETKLPGVKLLETQAFTDARGSFLELWQADRYEAIQAKPFQDNLSYSKKGVLRGLHYQWPRPQSKLVSVVWGEVFDVAVDIRVGSPTFGQWVGYLLNQDNHHQLYIPEGFAHGFCVTSEVAVFHYKCGSPYDPSTERTIRWDDKSLAIDWPVSDPILSDKDAEGFTLQDPPEGALPRFSG